MGARGVRRVAQGLAEVLCATALSLALLDVLPAPEPQAPPESAVAASQPVATARPRPTPGELADTFGSLWDADAPRTTIGARLREDAPQTAVVVGVALVVAFGLSTLLAAVQATWRGRLADVVLSATYAVVQSVPLFVIASLTLDLFPVRLHPLWHVSMDAGEGVVGPTWRDAPSVLVPAAPLVLSLVAMDARYLRGALTEALSSDYARTLRAAGFGRAYIAARAVRTSSGRILSLAALLLPSLFTGSLVIEKVFTPGTANLMKELIDERDAAGLSVMVVIAAALVNVGTVVADLLRAWSDPRLES